MKKKTQPSWLHYAIAVIIVILATAIRFALDPLLASRMPLAVFLFAIMLSAWICGAGPTVLAIFLSAMSATYFFMEPRGSLVLRLPTDQAALLTFMSVSLFIAFLSGQLNQARERVAWQQMQRESEQALKVSEEKARVSERLYRAIGESIDYGVWVCDASGQNIYTSPSFLQLVGLTQEQCAEFGWSQALHPDDADSTMAAWKECVATRGKWDREHRMRGVDGNWHSILARGVPVYDEQGQLLWFAGLSLDIARIKNAEQELQHAHDQLEQRVEERTLELTHVNQDLSREVEERRAIETKLRESEDGLRRLAAQLTTTEDTERRRLAADLHDSISQSLSLLKLNLEPLAEKFAGQPNIQNRFSAALEILNGVIKQTRTLMFELYPAMLHDLGLVPTLLWYSEQLHNQAQVIVSETGKALPLPPPLASDLFRAAKETLGNAVRHGRAREIYVSVHWRNDLLKIVIDDDGCGFDPAMLTSPQSHHGLGLAGIKERLISCQGKMLIESETGQGARVIMEVPLGREGN